MHANSVDPEKLIALKLLDLNWLDRRWMLNQLDAQTQQKVKRELAALKAMKVQNPQALLAQIVDFDTVPTLPDNTALPQTIDEFSFSPKLVAQLLKLSSDGGQTALQLRQAINEYLVAGGVSK